MSADEPYPTGPPGTPPSPSDTYFTGLTYGRAWTPFWLGVAAMFCCGLFTGIPAIYVGWRSLGDIQASHGRLVGSGLAWVGIVLGVLGTVGSVSAATWYEAH